jgi:hypothetical protein
VRQILAGINRVKGSPYVFFRPCRRGIDSSLDRVWRAVRRQAGLDGLRLHDLRHSYASVAVGSGEELRTVAVLLGHSQMVTTMGYAHLVEQPVMAAAQRIDHHLSDALTPPDPVEPIRPENSMPNLQARRKGSEPSPAILETSTRIAVFYARTEPPIDAEPTGQIEPAPLKRRTVSEEDRHWAPRIPA